jgi:hypothetical protein
VNIRRGDIFYADLRPVVGSEQGGVRPVLVVQNDTGNRHSPTVIIAAITSRIKTKLPTHVEIDSGRYKGMSVWRRNLYEAVPYLGPINKLFDLTTEDYMFTPFGNSGTKFKK